VFKLKPFKGGIKGIIWHAKALQKLFLKNELEKRFFRKRENLENKKRERQVKSFEKRNKNI